MIVTRQMTKAFACEDGYLYLMNREHRAIMAENRREGRAWTKKYNKMVGEYVGSWEEWLDWTMYYSPFWRIYMWIRKKYKIY